MGIVALSLLVSLYFSWKECEPLNEFLYRWFCNFSSKIDIFIINKTSHFFDKN